MDYSKVAKAKTYFEAVELLRPLTERAESIGSLYEINIKRYYDGNVWVELTFKNVFSEPDGDVDVTMVLYEDDHNNFYMKCGEDKVSGFFSSQGIDEHLEWLFNGLSGIFTGLNND